MPRNKRGPTVFQAAMARLAQVNQEMAALRHERKQLAIRAAHYRNSPMLESERLARQLTVTTPPTVIAPPPKESS